MFAYGRYTLIHYKEHSKSIENETVFTMAEMENELNVFFKISSRCPCGVMVKTMDRGIVISNFELQSCY